MGDNRKNCLVLDPKIVFFFEFSEYFGSLLMN